MSRLLITAAALISIGFAGCDNKNNRKPQTGPKGPAQPKATQLDRSKCDTRGKRVVQLDLNRDKQPDVWNIYSKRTEGGATVDVLTCKAIDLNFDGRRDMWKYYNNAGALEREEMDLDFDGRVDIVSFRRNGKIFRQEMDTNYDRLVLDVETDGSITPRYAVAKPS